MAIYQDFKELLESFNAHNVEYVVVGAHALVLQLAGAQFKGNISSMDCSGLKLRFS